MSDKLFHLVMAAISLVIAYCCLAMASKWDDISEKEWEEFERKGTNKKIKHD